MRSIYSIYLVLACIGIVACDECRDVTCPEGTVCNEGDCFYSSDSVKQQDPCKNVTCKHGECTDGTCKCEEFYFGDRCDSTLSDRYSGIFKGSFSCASSEKEFNAETIPGEPNRFLLKNDEVELYCLINSKDHSKFTIEQSTGAHPSKGQYTADGFGGLSGRNLSFTVNLDYKSEPDETCKFNGVDY